MGLMVGYVGEMIGRGRVMVRNRVELYTTEANGGECIEQSRFDG